MEDDTERVLEHLDTAEEHLKEARSKIEKGENAEAALSAALVALKASAEPPTPSLIGVVQPPTQSEVQSIRASIMTQIVEQRRAELTDDLG